MKYRGRPHAAGKMNLRWHHRHWLVTGSKYSLSRALGGGVQPVQSDVAGARLGGGGPVSSRKVRGGHCSHCIIGTNYIITKEPFPSPHHPSKSCPHLGVARALSKQAFHAGLHAVQELSPTVGVVGARGAGAHCGAAADSALHGESKAFRRCHRRACGLQVASASPEGSPKGRGCSASTRTPKGRSRKTRQRRLRPRCHR